MDISQVLKTFFISLGFITTINIGFTPVEINTKNEQISLTCQLEGAVTKEIKQLILYSTKVGIEYKITLFSHDKKWTYIQNKSVLYESITDEFVITNNNEIIKKTKDFNEVVEELIIIKTPLEIKGRMVVIKAKLIIPEIKDNKIVESLWGNINPRMTYKF